MSTLYPFQKSAVDWLSSPVHEHLAVISGTGSGKSKILYERAALTGTRTLLVCPLIALGRQHEQILRTIPLKVCCSMGTVTPTEPDADTQVWIASPELIFSPRGKRILSRWTPNFLCVDEAHCIWEWGTDFRPEYRKIPELACLPGIEQTLWLSATLTHEHLGDLSNILQGTTQSPLYLQGSFELPREIEIRITKAPYYERLDLLQSRIEDNLTALQSGIIFVNSRSLATRLYQLLMTQKECRTSYYFYHAGLSREERNAIEQKMREPVSHTKRIVLISTSAFGMGMDFPSLKFAILFQPPHSLLSIAQYLGRVGRSRSQATVDLYWDPSDFKPWGNKTGLTKDQSKVQNFFESTELALKNDPKALLSEYFSYLG